MEDVENILMEIKESLGHLDANVSSLKENGTQLKENGDRLSSSLSKFKDDMTERIIVIENRTEEIRKDFNTHCTSTEWIGKKVSQGDIYLKAAVIAWTIIVALVSLFLTVYKTLGITFVVG
jgi:hypothetical protein